jgi:hypothetical protein
VGIDSSSCKGTLPLSWLLSSCRMRNRCACRIPGGIVPARALLDSSSVARLDRLPGSRVVGHSACRTMQTVPATAGKYQCHGQCFLQAAGSLLHCWPGCCCLSALAN